MREITDILEDILDGQHVTNALLRVLGNEQLDQMLDQLASDEVDGALIRTLVAGQTPAGTLTQQVMTEAGVKERTVQEHIAQLIVQGLVQRIGAGPGTAYKLTSLFSPPQLSRLRRNSSKAVPRGD